MTGDDLRRKLVELFRDNTPKQAVVCEVLSVDESTLTCEVKDLETDAELFKVRLNAGESTLNTVLIPKVGSAVIVGILGNDIRARYVAMVSEVDKIYLNGGENGGLIKVADLVSRLNAVEQDINNLKKAFSSWVPVANDGGAKLKADTSSWWGTLLTKTTRGHIENEKIVH